MYISFREMTLRFVSSFHLHQMPYYKIHLFLKQCFFHFTKTRPFSWCQYSLERFGEKDLVFTKWRLCRHRFKNEWTLVAFFCNWPWTLGLYFKSARHRVTFLLFCFYFSYIGITLKFVAMDYVRHGEIQGRYFFKFLIQLDNF